MNPFSQLLYEVVQLYIYVVFAWFILSWLIALKIVNRYQPIVQKIDYALFRLTNPPLRLIRRYLPDLGNIDISPIILLLFLRFFQHIVLYYSY